VVPPIGTSKSVRLLKNDPRLNRAVRLDDLGDFMAAVATVSTRKQHSIIWELNEKSVAIATDDQLRRLAAFSQNEFIRRGMNQRTLEKIYARRPVRPSKLAKCLNVLQQCETPNNRRVNVPGAGSKQPAPSAKAGRISPASISNSIKRLTA
jgi:hypothetical protein